MSARWRLAAAIFLMGPTVVFAPPVFAEEAATTDHVARTEATRSVAMKFLHAMFVERDVRGAYDTFAAENLIQHNPAMADGLAGHRAYFARLEARSGASATWANVNNMLLVDGDLFALHHHAFTGPDDPGRVFVDIWRVADGKIVEHWDVIQAIPAEMAHDNGMGCGLGDDYPSALALHETVSVPACGLPVSGVSREENLAILDAYSATLLAGDVTGAIDRFLTEDYVQHSPVIQDGKQGALAFLLDEFGKGDKVMPKMGPMRIIAEGDFVLMHRLTEYADGLRTANVDIFRLRGGKISAHWDLKQEIPESAANNNGMW